MSNATIATKLINDWILHKLFLLQTNYNKLFEEKKINIITNELIKFIQNVISCEYLELLKIYPTNWKKRTKKTFLFVLQQTLILLNPFIPFLTNELYQTLTKKEINGNTIQQISETNIEEKNLWEIECIVSLIKEIKEIKKKKKVEKFFFDLSIKKKPSFNWNFILKKVNNINFFFKTKKNLNFKSLPPFGILFFDEKEKIKNLEEELKKKKSEIERCLKLLSNSSFVKKAPSFLVEEEKRKLDFYEKQIVKITQQLKKTKKKENDCYS